MSSRRDFLNRSLGGLSAAWLALRSPEILAAAEHAHQAVRTHAQRTFGFFTPDQASEIEAVAAQIIPSDGTPGAREAGVVYFIDRALTSFDRENQDLYKEGLAELQKRTAKLCSPAKAFSQLGRTQQIELLQKVEETEFFEQVLIHTVMGFLANPEYGGNRDRVGWKLIGFEDRSFYEPPFGFYDIDYEPPPEKE